MAQVLRVLCQKKEKKVGLITGCNNDGLYGVSPVLEWQIIEFTRQP